MDIIVEIQGLRGKNGVFLPKEIAVLSIEEPLVAHWIVAPPYPFAELPKMSRTQNMYLSKFYHGLEWFEGDLSCEQLYANLRQISRESVRIYTRGRDKAKLLCDVTSRNIINLEDDEDMPSFSHLPRTSRKCMRHGLIRNEAALRCALTNAYAIKKWIRDHPYVGESYGQPYSEDLSVSDPEEYEPISNSRSNTGKEEEEEEKEKTGPVTEHKVEHEEEEKSSAPAHNNESMSMDNNSGVIEEIRK